jgi:hypothetical protein
MHGGVEAHSHHPSPASSHASSFSSSASPQHEATYLNHRRAPIRTNVDVIPGLAYYGVAVGILGKRIVASDLVAVQAFLLAGLYAGQLARVHESYKWINLAGQACHQLIVP